jgi:RND family efflux transporter MFP subunit
MDRTSLALALIVALSCRKEQPPMLHAESTPPTRAAVGVTAVTIPLAVERDGRVVSEPARRGAVHDVVSSPCEVVPGVDGSAQVATTVLARIVAWHVAPGDVVRAGAPVVTLDAPVVAQERTEFARAEVDARELEHRVREEGEMLQQGATSARSVRESRTSLARANGALAAARRALSVAQASERGSGGTFTLRAPIAGTVTVREGLRGAVVDAPSALVTLVDLSGLRIAAHLPEQSVDVPFGAHASVSLRGRPGTLSAHVVWRDPWIARDTRTRLVHMALDGSASGFAPGETGVARIERTAGEGVVVPTAAVYRAGERATVYVRLGDGRYAPRDVVTGHESGDVVEVVSGLEAGEPVVVRGVFLVAAEHARQGAAE